MGSFMNLNLAKSSNEVTRTYTNQNCYKWFLAAWFLRGFPMEKLEAKSLFYKELIGGFVRLSLRKT
jgi:hypothetical protein